MKTRHEEFLAQYPVGCKVLLKPLNRRSGKDWRPARVITHVPGLNTVRVICQEEHTANLSHIYFGAREQIKRACEVEGCWEPAALIVDGKNYCSDHLPADNSVPG
jgi:hypothetical protein